MLKTKLNLDIIFTKIANYKISNLLTKRVQRTKSQAFSPSSRHFSLRHHAFSWVGALVILAHLWISQSVEAKELTNRLGIGQRYDWGVEGLPQLAAVYHPLSDLAVTSAVGVDTQDANSRFAVNVGARKIIFKEPNLNFYVGGNIGLINFEESGTKNAGYEMAALFGAEFFIPGLDSLGFSFDAGVGIVSASKVRFKTIADNPLRAAMVFYF